MLTHWGRVMHICVSKLTIIGADNGLSLGWRQAIIWTNAGILLIRALGTNISEILIKICAFSLKKMLLKMSSGKRRPSCLGLNVLTSRGHKVLIIASMSGFPHQMQKVCPCDDAIMLASTTTVRLKKVLVLMNKNIYQNFRQTSGGLAVLHRCFNTGKHGWVLSNFR